MDDDPPPPVKRDPPAHRKRGRTRWDAFTEAVQGGWGSTARLALLLAVTTGSLCGLAVVVLKFLEAWLRHR